MRQEFLKSLIELTQLTDKTELQSKQLEVNQLIDNLKFVTDDPKFSSLTKGLLKTNVDDFVKNPNATYKHQIEIQISMIGEVILK